MYQKKGVNLPCNKSITNMTIKIKVIDQLTGKVEIDSQIEVSSTMDTVRQNHEVFRQAFPNCQVNFFIDDKNFICSPAVNMENDERAYGEGLITWKQYCDKWYKGALSSCNEDDDIVILERYEAEDWASRDAVCY